MSAGPSHVQAGSAPLADAMRATSHDDAVADFSESCERQTRGGPEGLLGCSSALSALLGSGAIERFMSGALERLLAHRFGPLPDEVFGLGLSEDGARIAYAGGAGRVLYAAVADVRSGAEERLRIPAGIDFVPGIGFAWAEERSRGGWAGRLASRGGPCAPAGTHACPAAPATSGADNSNRVSQRVLVIFAEVCRRAPPALLRLRRQRGPRFRVRTSNRQAIARP